MTAQDFTTRLQRQLREAAEREERRSAARRRAATARAALAPRIAAGPLAAAAAAALALVIGLWALTARTDDPEPATPPGPRPVTTVALGQSLNGTAALAAGALWAGDPNGEEVLRIDPRTRRVIARIRVGGEPAVGAGAGSVWVVRNRPPATASGPVLRIDPRTNRIVARIELPPGVGAFRVLAAPRRVWLLGPTAALAIDPARDRIVHRIPAPGGYSLDGATLYRGALWLHHAGGTTTRYDARTGARLGRVRWNPEPSPIPFGDGLIDVGRRAVALRDPETGRTIWRTAVAHEINLAEMLGGRLFVQGVDGVSPRERLWEVDPVSGRAGRPLVLPAFGLAGMVPIGRELWLLAGGGQGVVVRP